MNASLMKDLIANSSAQSKDRKNRSRRRRVELLVRASDKMFVRKFAGLFVAYIIEKPDNGIPTL